MNKPAEPERMQKMGVVVNLNERTVSFLGYVARINEVDTANINLPCRHRLLGDKDRIVA